MSAYLNLTVEQFFKECEERTILTKARIAQKQKVQVEEKGPPLWRTWFQLTSIDLDEGVILKCTITISTSLSNPWSEKAFEDDRKGYEEAHERILKRIEEEAAKHYPAFGDKNGKLKEGEWSWGE